MSTDSMPALPDGTKFSQQQESRDGAEMFAGGPVDCLYNHHGDCVHDAQRGKPCLRPCVLYNGTADPVSPPTHVVMGLRGPQA